jgi:hypothetical protein
MIIEMSIYVKLTFGGRGRGSGQKEASSRLWARLLEFQKVLAPPAFQRRSADLLRTVERTFGAQRVIEPCVEKIE